MDNIDAEALAEANRNGSTIMYFAGVAQRFPNPQAAANPQRRVNRDNGAEVPQRPPARPAPAARAPQNNEIEEAPPAPAQVRPAARRVARANGGQDAVRVGNY